MRNVWAPTAPPLPHCRGMALVFRRGAFVCPRHVSSRPRRLPVPPPPTSPQRHDSYRPPRCLCLPAPRIASRVRRLPAIKYGGPLWCLAFLIPWWPWSSVAGSWLVGLHFAVSICMFDSFLTYVRPCARAGRVCVHVRVERCCCGRSCTAAVSDRPRSSAAWKWVSRRNNAQSREGYVVGV